MFLFVKRTSPVSNPDRAPSRRSIRKVSADIGNAVIEAHASRGLVVGAGSAGLSRTDVFLSHLTDTARGAALGAPSVAIPWLHSGTADRAIPVPAHACPRE